MKKETLLESLKEIDSKLVNEVKKQDLFTDIYEVTDFDLLGENFGDIALYKINEITYEEEEKAPRREAFENVLGALRDSFNNFLYTISFDMCLAKIQCLLTLARFLICLKSSKSVYVIYK